VPINLGALVFVTALAAAAPVIADFVPRHALPVVVVELLLGIVVGKHGLGLTEPTDLLRLLAQFGLAFLFFLAGFEIEPERLRGLPSRLAAGAWAGSLALGLAIAGLLEVAGVIVNYEFVGVALTTTALGTLVPILRDSGSLEGVFGSQVMATGAMGELGPIVLIALLLTSTSDRALSAALLIAFAGGAVTAALIAPRIKPRRILAIVDATMEASGQLAVRLAVVLLTALVYLTSRLGLDMVLGAFSAGLLASVAIGPRGRQQLAPRLDAVGFGVFIPIFFITTGMTFDVEAVFGSAAGVLKLLLFVVLLLVVRGLPTFVLFRRAAATGDRRALALYASTGLPMIVAITTLGVAAGQMRLTTASALVGAGMVSVLVFPPLAASFRTAATGEQRFPETVGSH
jgi:Kef-type K+ transport system membrane component KefB